MPTHILLVRHGQSTFNAAKRFQGCCDASVLTETGRLTAYQTGLALRNIGFDAVYVSPLRRTQETAQEILAAIAPGSSDIPIVRTHPHLKEVDLPQWEGLLYEAVRSRFPAAYRQWQEAPHTLQMERGQRESQAAVGSAGIATLASATQSKPFYPLQQLYEQAQQFWQEILAQHEGQTVLVISHGGTIRALISTAIGLEINHYPSLQQSNSGINVLTFAQIDQLAQLQALNLTDHLGEVLPKLKNGKQGLRLLLLPVANEMDRISALADRLQSVPLDICITETSELAQAIATEFLSQPSQSTLQLPINQQNFLQIWHEMINGKSQHLTTLSTALIITNRDGMSLFLHRLLRLSEQTQVLHLEPGEISVLYYPASTAYPILQAMNLGADAIARNLFSRDERTFKPTFSTLGQRMP